MKIVFGNKNSTIDASEIGFRSSSQILGVIVVVLQRSAITRENYC